MRNYNGSDFLNAAPIGEALKMDLGVPYVGGMSFFPVTSLYEYDVHQTWGNSMIESNGGNFYAQSDDHVYDLHVLEVSTPRGNVDLFSTSQTDTYNYISQSPTEISWGSSSQTSSYTQTSAITFQPPVYGYLPMSPAMPQQVAGFEFDARSTESSFNFGGFVDNHGNSGNWVRPPTTRTTTSSAPVAAPPCTSTTRSRSSVPTRTCTSAISPFPRATTHRSTFTP